MIYICHKWKVLFGGGKTLKLFLESQTYTDRVQTNPRVVLNSGKG